MISVLNHDDFLKKLSLKRDPNRPGHWDVEQRRDDSITPKVTSGNTYSTFEVPDNSTVVPSLGDFLGSELSTSETLFASLCVIFFSVILCYFVCTRVKKSNAKKKAVMIDSVDGAVISPDLLIKSEKVEAQKV